MMNGSRHVATVDMLLNALESERHVRKALLLNLLDELSDLDGFEPAVDAARDLLDELEGGPVDQTRFVQRIATVRELVRILGPRPSGIVPADPTRQDDSFLTEAASAA